MPLKDKKF